MIHNNNGNPRPQSRGNIINNKIMKASEFLSELSVYPKMYEIDEASNEAQDKATEYVHSIDPSAEVTVEDGEVYIKSDVLDSEQTENAQVVFDEAFSEKIHELGYSE